MTEKDATPKRTKAATKAKKPKTAPTHPKVSDMVDSAIQSLKERGGSSLQAIKKYISSNYKVDADKLAPFIRKYLKSAVSNGGLVQTKGKGASGSFRMGGATKSVAKPKKAVAKPKATATAKKAAKPKKAPVKSKPKKASPVKKTKPAAKTAAKKAKSPKKKPAKKASPKKKAAPKKARK